MTRDALLKEALRLPVGDRADIAAELLASLDDEAPDDLEAAEKAWAIEIERRGRRMLAGRISRLSLGKRAPTNRKA